MLRTTWTTVAPRAAAVTRSLAPATARRATFPTAAASQGPSCVSSGSVAAALASSSARKCSWRGMSSSSNMAKASGDESQGEGGGESGETGSTGNGSRDPETGEGMWMDDEDEPLVLEKPKKVQKFCGKVISDRMDKTIKVAVPYSYYVKGLGRKIIRHSKLMAHDEENSANVGDRVILVDCRRKSKRKNHILHKIVHKLPRLDD